MISIETKTRTEDKNLLEWIKYYLIKISLEQKLKKYQSDLHQSDKWYETYIDWCCHTDSENTIYNSYTKDKLAKS